MLNCKGVAFVETLLTVAIILIISGALLPLSYHLKSTLYNEKLELYASETALEAAKLIMVQTLHSGSKTIERNEFQWMYEGNEICVRYQNLDGEQVKCINQNGS